MARTLSRRTRVLFRTMGARVVEIQEATIAHASELRKALLARAGELRKVFLYRIRRMRRTCLACFVTEGQGSQSPCMGSAASKQKDVPLTPAPAPVCFTSDQYCMGHHVTLTLQKKKRSKRRLSAIWYGRMQKLSVEDPDGKTIFEVHRASWTFASRTSLLDPHHRTILKFVRPFGLQPTWKIKAESRRGRDQAVIVRRPVFAARPQVKVYLPAAIKPSGVTAGEPDFTVSANIATKDLVVYSVGGGRRPAVAQLVCSGAEEGRDGLLRVAANMDVALVLAIFLASDALLYAGLMQT